MPDPPVVTAAATASPEHRLDREEMKRWCRHLYGERRGLPGMLRIVDRSGVELRQLALPPERIIARRSFGERNAEYAVAAIALAEAAARSALERARLAASAIDFLVTTSCTGLLIPSLGSYLVPRLGLRPDVVRLPITELGCAAGAAALARAADHLRAFPDRTALVVAVELPSVTFHESDPSMTQFVASAIFGDGAAAAVVRGPSVGEPGIEILRSRGHLFPDSARLMGFDVGEGGLRIVLARDVPAFLDGRVRPLVEALLGEEGLAKEALAFAVIHPGGARILENLERELGLPRALTEPSWRVLARHGNMSSATILFVLERVLGAPPPPAGSHGLLAAFGPGFAAELSLLRWRAHTGAATGA
jgi:alkylresorcinol/alkylpyrone synthase